MATTDAEYKSNLNAAILNGSISASDLHALIAEYEENGDQHIFFYKVPESPLFDRITSFEKASSDLFGLNWGKSIKFPSYSKPGMELEWIDFRKGRDSHEIWVGKLHLEETGFRNAGEKKRISGTQYEQPMEICKYRVVFVVRMLMDGILEVRISRDGNTSFKVMNERLNSAWEALDSLVKLRQVSPWDLAGSRTKQLRTSLADVGKNSLSYSVVGCSLQDSEDGSVKFSANGSIFQAAASQTAMRAFIQDSSGTCKSLAIKLMKIRSENKLRTDLRVAIGGHSTNEVVILSKIDANAFRYVAEHLKFFDS